ncbi:MAG TPA: hypothetical protein VGG21_02595 [Acidimicrobiales bacterium]
MTGSTAPTRLVHRLLVASDIGASGVWWLPDCLYGGTPGISEAIQPSVNLKTAVSSELLAALQAWNDLGVDLFSGREVRPIEDVVKRAYVELGSFLATTMQNELGCGWEVLYQDSSNSWTWVQRSVRANADISVEE